VRTWPEPSPHELSRQIFRGRYLVGHLVVLAVALLFVRLGFWQLDRFHEVRQRNSLLQSRMERPPAPLETLGGPPAEAVYRRVTVRGRFRPDQEVRVLLRSLDGVAGEFLMTPLERGRGPAVLVNRGWIPQEGVPSGEAAAPTGEVVVSGIALPSEPGGRSVERPGRPRAVNRIDIPLMEGMLSRPLYPLYVQLQGQEPPESDGYPRALPQPRPDQGPHLSYAIQWFLFTGIGLIGWPILVGRSLRADRAAQARSAP
jgi:cytochrome oxidase assembly protein ShyY1